MKNRDKKMPVVEPIREEDWMWFRFVQTLIIFLMRMHIAHLFTSFRGDMVELLKGPDKGKLGIIKMIVQVYFPTITKTAKYKYIYLDDADAAVTFTSIFPGAQLGDR